VIHNDTRSTKCQKSFETFMHEPSCSALIQELDNDVINSYFFGLVCRVRGRGLDELRCVTVYAFLHIMLCILRVVF
jgi:hypothetical protein